MSRNKRRIVNNIEPSTLGIGKTNLEVPPPKKLRFSFRFFSQQPEIFFGLKGVKASWYFSFLSKLKEYEKIDIAQISKARTARFHEIDWETSPIRRKDLSIPEQYASEKDYPIFQFAIATSTGRFMGFFDENYIFNILVLDPKHNMQFSIKRDRKAERTYPETTDFESLVEKLKSCKSGPCMHLNSYIRLNS